MTHHSRPFFIILLFVVGVCSASPYLHSAPMDPSDLVGNVYGTVTDATTGEPLAGVEIILVDSPLQPTTKASSSFILSNKGIFTTPNYESRLRTTSNLNGEFLINSVPTPFPGKQYTIIARASGYDLEIINEAWVSPGALMSLGVEFTLRKYTGEAVFYSADEPEAPLKTWQEDIAEREGVISPICRKAGATPKGLSGTIYATREGLVGGTTANGHVIEYHDHFVALPSTRVLCSNGGHEFEVKLSYGGNTVTEPVWDVGPWNIYDNYWDPEAWRIIYDYLHYGGQPGLGQGVPEAEEAYLHNYNQKYSGEIPGYYPYGQYVLNPAGIDLADGTFWDSLGLSDNTWISVEFLWMFDTGDWVETTDSLNMRGGHGLEYDIITTLPEGSTGQIVSDADNGIYVDGYYWWHTQFGSNNGWCAGHRLKVSDGSTVTCPVVDTSDASNVTPNTAYLWGQIVDDGGSGILDRAFCWSTQTDATCNDNDTLNVTVDGNVFYYQASSLSADTTYYFRAWARNSIGWGYGQILSFTTSSVSLSPPTGVSASDGTYTDKVRITWNSVSGASYYRVYRGTSSRGTKTALSSWQTSTNYDDTSATPGATYYYWVKAATSSSGANASDYSSYDTGWRKLVSPSAPSGVSASKGIYTDKVRITWNSVSGASYYQVYRATSSGETKTTLSSWQTSLSYYDTSATPGATYYYWVKAATSSSGANSSDYSAYDTGWRKLVSPSGVSASKGTYTDKVRITWNSVSGASYYQVYRASSSGGAKTALSNWQTSTSYDDTSATPGTVYYYWVRAATSSSGANSSDYSAYDIGSRAQEADPSLCYEPSSLDFSTGYTSETFDVWNCGGGTLSYSISNNQAWMSVSPTPGSSTGEHDTITVTVNRSGLSPGHYSGIVTIDPNYGSNQTVSVSMDVAESGETSAVFRVTPEGDVLADGLFYGQKFLAGSADIAEWISVTERVEPGDVLELDPENPGHYRKSRGPCSTLVAGVVSTDPGFVLGGSATDDSLPTTHAQALLALVGIVPVKVTNEGGPIQPADLLISSSTPGYAMRWNGDSPCPCALVGKALESFDGEEGVIKVLLTAH